MQPVEQNIQQANGIPYKEWRGPTQKQTALNKMY